MASRNRLVYSRAADRRLSETKVELGQASAASGCEPQDRPWRREDVSCHELDGEALLYDAESGAVHRFDTVTLLVWDACDGLATAAEIARAVTQRYAIDPAEALVHVQGVIVEFGEKGLLQSDDRNPERSCDDSGANPAGARMPSRTTAASTSATGGGRYSPSPGLSRRELLTGGATKLVFAAPVISTFFATGAYASAPSYSGAFGEGCKNVGYSCTITGKLLRGWG